MLGGGVVETTEQVFFTAPEGTRTSVSINLCNTSTATNRVTVKINSIPLAVIELQPNEQAQYTQLVLDGGDTVSAVATVDGCYIVITGVVE